jgi:hypothetical protein
MRGPLARLLRLRTLLEDSSRMELERRAALAARIDGAQQHEQQNIRESRAQALATICEDSASQARQPAAEWMNVEHAQWRSRRLEPLAQAAAQSALHGQQDYFDRRKERRQVESVLDAERALLTAEQERRAQRELDDWFSIKQVREQQKLKSNPHS